MNVLCQVHITTGGGKMKGISSVNTSSLKNEFCQKLVKINNSVCTRCYSNRYSKLRPSLEKRLKNNSELLSSSILEEHELPVFNARYVRFNSFGELINDAHYLNLIAIARRNPYTIFGLWTKRHEIVMKYPKQHNVKYIYSVTKVNGKAPREAIMDFFDKIFIVQNTDQNQNCYGDCLSCLKCYTGNGDKVIREKLK